MINISDNQAIDLARQSLGLDPAVPAQALEVKRLDQIDRSYFLVIFGDNEASVAIAAVDTKCSDIQSSAVLSGKRAHLTLTHDAAISLAGTSNETQADLVWKPCDASLSPLYPLWRVRSASSTSYVDMNGKVWNSLRTGGPGGTD